MIVCGPVKSFISHTDQQPKRRIASWTKNHLVKPNIQKVPKKTAHLRYINNHADNHFALVRCEIIAVKPTDAYTTPAQGSYLLSLKVCSMNVLLVLSNIVAVFLRWPSIRCRKCAKNECALFLQKFKKSRKKRQSAFFRTHYVFVQGWIYVDL